MDALVLRGRSIAVKHFLCQSSDICERDWPFTHVEAAVGKALGELLINACFMPSQNNWSKVRQIWCL